MVEHEPRTFGLIPAAGKSRRMGTPKLLLPLGGATVLQHVLAAVRAAGVADVLVVAAPGAEVLANLARAAGAHVAQLEADTPDMRATAQHGLAWIEEHWRPAADDRWLLLPADHPTVRSELVRTILAASRPEPEASIVVPTFQGRRGHPTRLAWRHVSALRSFPADQGLNAFIRAHAAGTLEVPWDSDEILRDLDTPEDYARLITLEE